MILETLRDEWLQKIASLPFVQGIQFGNLTQIQRDYYLAQDHYYLAIYGVATEEIDNILALLSLQAKASDKYEKSAHEALQPSIQWQDMPIGRVTREYAAFIAEVMAGSDALKKMLVMLPCLESYHLLARHMKQDLRTSSKYAAWINFYTQDTYVADVLRYQTGVAQLIAQKDELADEDIAIYQQAYQYEHNFWQVCMVTD